MKVNKSINSIVNIATKNLINTPASIVKGFSWVHFLPSHINYSMMAEDSGCIERIADEVSSTPFYNQSKDLSDDLKRHFYGKITRMGSSIDDSILSFITITLPQYSISLFAGCSAIALYIEAVQKYGAKALLPVVVTTGLSLVYEGVFNHRVASEEEKQSSLKYLDRTAIDDKLAH